MCEEDIFRPNPEQADILAYDKKRPKNCGRLHRIDRIHKHIPC